MLKSALANRKALVGVVAILAVVAVAAAVLAFRPGDSDANSGSLRVTDVVLARGVTAEFAPQGSTFTFPTNARQIWAVVGLENVRNDVTVTGTWNYLGPTGKADAVRIAEASVDVDAGANLTRRSSLSLRKDTDFDAGVYELKVLIDGKQSKVLQFNVVPANQIAGVSPTVAPATATTAPAASTTPAATVTVAPTATRPPAVTPQQSVQGTVATPTMAPTAPPPTETPVPTPTNVPGTYVVKPGDTLASIAALHGTTVQLVAAANNITNPSSISVGQVLVIPTPPPAR